MTNSPTRFQIRKEVKSVEGGEKREREGKELKKKRSRLKGGGGPPDSKTKASVAMDRAQGQTDKLDRSEEPERSEELPYYHIQGILAI